MRSEPAKRRVPAARFRFPMATRTFASFQQESPCLACGPTYCCGWLRLASLATDSFRDFDYMRFLVGFRDVRILVDPAGAWTAFLRRDCSRLDKASGLCTVRGTSEHPRVCREFSPYGCWYQASFSGQDTRAGPRALLDAAKLDVALGLAEFDAFGNATSIPGPADIAEALARTRRAAVRAAATPKRAPLAADVPPRGEPTSPCTGCPAPCCRNLYFARDLPTNYAEMDLLRYALGFRGVSFVATASRFVMCVRTRCDHLDDSGRCSLYGDPARPKHCEFFDEWRCEIKRDHVLEIGRTARLDGVDAWARLADAVSYDAAGALTRPLTHDAIAAAVRA
jgi:hypothetical protein